MTDPFESNYYEVLEVSPEAPQHEIHEAFQRAKKTYSTDSPALYSMFSQEEAQQLIKLIEEAFAVLGNQARRKAYDEHLRAKKNGAKKETATDFGAPLDPDDWGGPPAAASEIAAWGIPGEDAKFSPAPAHPLSPPPPPVSAAAPAPEKKAPEQERVPFGRTPLSSYKLSLEMEDEIAQQTIFDGTFLRKVREYKNVDLGQLSDATKVSRNYLQAIESNRFTDLPAPVFVRGFLLQITRILGLNSQVVSTSYIKLMKESLNR